MKLRNFLLVFCLIPVFAMASHKVAGVELTYECKSSGMYDVYIHVVRHCDGTALGAKDLIARCSSFTLTVPAAQQSLVSSQKLNSCQSSPCSGIGNYEERVWKAELDLSAYSCCEWTLSYYNDFRYNGQQYYIQSVLNKCAEVSGGYFIQKPQITLRYNEDLALNFGFRSYDPADSLSYELVTALAGLNFSMTYSGNYSPQRPISFYGFPNQNLQWPAGFRLAYDGMLRFRPTLTNNQGAIAVEVKIWKDINGIKQVVGEIVRDIEVVTVIANVDAAPSIDFLMAKPDTVNLYFCAGDTTPLLWQSEDADDDSTFIDILFADPDIQLSTDYSQGKQVRIKALISSTLADTASTKVRYLRFWLRDNSCPFPRANVYTLALRTAKKPVAQFIQSVQCRQVNTSIQVSDSVNSSFRAWYTYYDDKHQLIGSSINGLFISTNLPLGTSYLDMAYGFQGGCSIDTSITLSILPHFKFGLLGSDAFCNGDSLKLELLKQGSTDTFTYQWTNLTSPTMPYLIDSQEIAWVYPPVNSDYEVTATDSSGCFLSYTWQVRRVELPQHTMDSVVLACPGDSAWIGPSTIQFSDQYLWVDGNIDFPRRADQVGWYVFTAVHENICVIRDSVYLGNHALPELTELPSDTNLCRNTNLFFDARQGSRPYTFYWNGSQTITPRTVTQNEFVKIEVKDNNGCRDSAEIQLWVSEKPNLSFSPGINSGLCAGDSVEISALNTPPNAVLIWPDSSNQNFWVFHPGVYTPMLIDSVGCDFLYLISVHYLLFPDPAFSYAAVPGGVEFTPAVLSLNHTWFFGDGNSSQNGQPIHAYASPGNYLVIHKVSDTVNSCEAPDSLSIVVLSLSQLKRRGIDVFPNPFEHAFSLHFAPETDLVQMKLLDLQGREVPFQSSMRGKELHVFGLENLAPGTYILRIQDSQGVVDTLLQKK